MAAKKQQGKGVATRNTKQEMANMDEELRKEVEGIQERIGSPESRKIQLTDKVFTLPSGQVVQGPLDVVILDFTNINAYYPSTYDPKNPAPPDCFAISKQIKGMAPVDESPDKQSPDCDSCWANEFGSGVGNGKACKNQRRLLVMLADDDPEEGELFTMEVSPSAIKKFDAYVSTVARLYQAPPVAVVTAVDFHPEQTYPSLIFSNPRQNPNYQQHFQRRTEGAPLLEGLPDFTVGQQEPPAKQSKRKGQGQGQRQQRRAR